MQDRPSALLAGACAALALLAFPQSASAQAVDCSSLTNVIYAPGTSDVKPFLSRIAPRLATAAGDDQVTIVYQSLGSCTALDYVLNGNDLSGTGVYWAGPLNGDGTGVESSCTIPAGAKADLAFSDVTTQTCTGTDIPSGVGEFKSLVQAFGFVAPSNSSQQAITATEAYFLFKFGGETGRQVPPWIDPNFIAIRTPASSTQLLIGLAIGVLGTQWSANLTNIHSGSGGLISAVAAENGTGNADKTLGILSLQRYDSSRDQLKMLAFEAFNQVCLGAVFPDSTPTAFDKRNVRDGHYPIWGHLWTMTAVDGSDAPTNAAVGRIIDFISGTAVVNDADPIRDAALAGGIPECAMTVQRSYDGGPLGCYFESIVGTTSCTACDDENPCAAGTCRFGYCEAQ
jgi:ABC-type phosphate transport system substrate-binding protein